jgi:uncharacterized protein with HEPN domain
VSLREIRLYVDDILLSIETIERYVKGKDLIEFEEDGLLRDGIYMRLQVIGEAVRRLPDEIRNRYRDIPWDQIVGLRNIISHAYSYLDAEEVWLTVKNDLPKLKEVVKLMLLDMNVSE